MVEGTRMCKPQVGDLPLEKVTLVYPTGETETFRNVAAQIITGHRQHYIVVVLPVEKVEHGTEPDSGAGPPGQ